MANTLNLDRSQRLDVVCKRGDTFKMNLELKDDDGTNIDLNGGYNGTDAIATPIYAFKMQVRLADTDDDNAEYDESSNTDGYLIESWATIANRDDNTADTYLDPTNLATFKIDHGDMEDLESGVYVYDIEKRLFNGLKWDDDGLPGTQPQYINWADTVIIEQVTPDDVETILYGVFTVNEDITL